MRHPLVVIGLSLCACKGTLPPYVATQDVEPEQTQDMDSDTPPASAQQAERFVGLWAVDQPFHAAYEVTYYDFQEDGTLVVGSSFPGDCTGHLEHTCVTGSVADCSPDPIETWCEPETTCVFGDSWRSEDDQTLVIEGHCSDDIARDIVLRFGSDVSQNSDFGIAPDLLTVGGQTDWAHNGWDWAFRKCPDNTECGLF